MQHESGAITITHLVAEVYSCTQYSSCGPVSPGHGARPSSFNVSFGSHFLLRRYQYVLAGPMNGSAVYSGGFSVAFCNIHIGSDYIVAIYMYTCIYVAILLNHHGSRAHVSGICLAPARRLTIPVRLHLHEPYLSFKYLVSDN